MQLPRQRRALRRARASLNQSAQWPELPEMATAMEQGKCQSIFRFGAQYQRSAGTNRVPAAAEKNTRTAAVVSRKS
jgi:hypothetical protein